MFNLCIQPVFIPVCLQSASSSDPAASKIFFERKPTLTNIRIKEGNQELLVYS